MKLRCNFQKWQLLPILLLLPMLVGISPGVTSLPTPVAVTFVVNSIAAPAVPGSLLNHHKRLEKFMGVNFKR
ncbi:hypothetical protein ACSBR1_029267 [Camellia fascicularis]